jgi:hypothetical protein
MDDKHCQMDMKPEAMTWAAWAGETPKLWWWAGYAQSRNPDWMSDFFRMIVRQALNTTRTLSVSVAQVTWWKMSLEGFLFMLLNFCRKYLQPSS